MTYTLKDLSGKFYNSGDRSLSFLWNVVFNNYGRTRKAIGLAIASIVDRGGSVHLVSFSTDTVHWSLPTGEYGTTRLSKLPEAINN